MLKSSRAAYVSWLVVIAVVLGMATVGGGCGEKSGHPLIEQREREREAERREAIICALSEGEAEARGPQDYEVWLYTCK